MVAVTRASYCRVISARRFRLGVVDVSMARERVERGQDLEFSLECRVVVVSGVGRKIGLIKLVLGWWFKVFQGWIEFGQCIGLYS